MKITKYNTVSLQIKPESKHRIKVLCAKYDCTQYDMIKALLKLEKQFKPELEDLLK